MIFTNQHCSLTYVLWTARGPWRRAATWQWHVQWAGRKIQILIWSEGACWNSRIRAHWNQIHHSRYEFVQLIQCWICLRHALLNPWDGDIWEWKSKWFLAFFAQSQEDDFGALQKKKSVRKQYFLSCRGAAGTWYDGMLRTSFPLISVWILLVQGQSRHNHPLIKSPRPLPALIVVVSGYYKKMNQCFALWMG